MNIANPIYDVVFKYLMDDTRAAKLIISYLTGFDVLDLEFKPTEHRVANVGENNFTVCRMDFAAKINTPEGPKVILIEIQKAKFATDIMRFRRYLGSQYSNPDNCISHIQEINGKTYEQKVATPIFTIYLLGHELEFGDVPVIRVERSCIDVVNNKVLDGKSEFIESLTHDSVVVQIPAIKGNRRNKLEMLLSFFDQDLTVDSTKHTLYIDDEKLPEELKFIHRILAKANSATEVKETMNIEDEVLAELGDKERMIALLREETEGAVKAKIKAEEEKQKAEVREQKMYELLKSLGHSEDEILKKLSQF